MKLSNSNLLRMMMMKMQTFSYFFLSLLIFSDFSAKARILNHFPSSSRPSKQAERLIRGLNLFPGLDANIVQDDPAETAPRLVEKQFQFPNIANSLANDSNGTVQDFGHHAGYYSLPNTTGARMFYFFFESRNKSSDVPVVIWLTGGPGCSSSLALFYENGPFHLTDNLTLVWNDYGWDTVSNLIYVDQPTGTGFSYSNSTGDIRSTSEQAGFDFYNFLQEFFKEHPQYAKNDFYITGESYAGHYIPAFATQIQQKNKEKTGIPINLKGLAIGNGWTHPEIQYKSELDYALDMKLIDKPEYESEYVADLVAKCETELKDCQSNSSSTACPWVDSNCEAIIDEIISYTRKHLNYYDIRKLCEGSLCYDFSNAEKFLNQESAKAALGVGNITFVSCSISVVTAMSRDKIMNSAVGVPALLQDGVKILIYAGEFDLLCNWLGNSRWVEAMEWSGQKEYLAAPNSPFTVDGVEAGVQKSYGPLSFLKVHNAGHMVPMDQPKNSVEMLRRWLQGSSPL